VAPELLPLPEPLWLEVEPPIVDPPPMPEPVELDPEPEPEPEPEGEPEPNEPAPPVDETPMDELPSDDPPAPEPPIEELPIPESPIPEPPIEAPPVDGRRPPRPPCCSRCWAKSGKVSRIVRLSWSVRVARRAAERADSVLSSPASRAACCSAETTAFGLPEGLPLDWACCCCS